MDEKEIEKKMTKALDIAQTIYVNFLNKNKSSSGSDYGTAISILATKIFDEIKSESEKK